MPQDYYEILEISRDATQTEVKQTVQDQLNDVKAALIILSDQEKRQAYDELLEKMNSPQTASIQSKESNKTTFRLLEAFIAIVILAMIAGGYWFVTGYTVPNSSTVINKISVAPPTNSHTKSVIIISESVENKTISPTTTDPSKSVINQAIAEEVVTPIKTTEQNVPLIAENVENQTDIAEKQAEVIIKSSVTPVEQEKSVVTEPVATEKTVITNTQTTPAKTTTPVNETVTMVQELPAKILYKDFFQQSKTIAITIALTNNLDKSIQSFDGIITLYEQDDSVIGAISLSEYDILKQINKPNKYSIQKNKTQRWGLNINASQNSALYTQIVNKRLTALKIKFFLTEVIYIDGEKVSF